jgi:hypothetical protein
MTALNELKRLDNIKLIVATPEWDRYFANISIESEIDLIELVEKVLNQLRSNEIREAKASALIGCLYLTRRISNICVRLREEPSASPLELDLSIALKLPGEAANGLTFNTAGRAFQADATNNIEGIQSCLESITANYSSGVSNHREQMLDLPLVSLSAIYTALFNVIQH